MYDSADSESRKPKKWDWPTAIKRSKKREAVREDSNKKKKKRREKEVFRLTLESTMRMLVFQAEHSTYTHIHTYTDNAIKTATTKKN